MGQLSPLTNNRIIEYIKNTLEIEGYEVTDDDLEMFRDVHRKGYNKEDIIKMVLKENGVNENG